MNLQKLKDSPFEAVFKLSKLYVPFSTIFFVQYFHMKKTCQKGSSQIFATNSLKKIMHTRSLFVHFTTFALWFWSQVIKGKAMNNLKFSQIAWGNKLENNKNEFNRCSKVLFKCTKINCLNSISFMVVFFLVIVLCPWRSIMQYFSLMYLRESGKVSWTDYNAHWDGSWNVDNNDDAAAFLLLFAAALRSQDWWQW